MMKTGLFILFIANAVRSPEALVVSRRALVPQQHQRVATRGQLSMRKGRPSTNLKQKKPPSDSSSQSVNWVVIAPSESDLPSEDGETAAVTLSGGKLLMVLRKNEKYHALSTSCTKCKFPLLKAQCDDDEPSLVCDVCGTKYDYTTGKVTGKKDKEGVAGVFSNIMSSSPGGPIEAYEVKVAPNGKVYAAMGTK